MDLAYLATEGRIERPPVAAVDLRNGKGRCLIASRFISKGEIIYTERALVGAQIPDLCATCNAQQEESRTAYKVRACQHCFRSLEPGSCLIPPSANLSDDAPTSQPTTIPLAHLWPVVEYQDFKDSALAMRTVEPFEYLLEDAKSRRVTCGRCFTPFCSKYCAKSYMAATGNCCQSNDAITGAIHGLVCNQDEENENKLDVAVNVIDPLYALATRMFCMLVQRHRAGDSLTLFDGLCGVADDATPLRLGDYYKDTDGYSLSNGYRLVSEALSLSEDERQGPLSLMTFHKLAAKAQRNGILLTTKSPFREYYGAVRRNTGGRGSARQQEVVSEIAWVLGSPDGKLSRDMDGLVEKKCAVSLAGLFALTATMNHSCDPNAEIRGGEYNDCHIDVAARQNIEKGQEICISYLDLGSDPSNSIIARNRRRRQLESKYLFVCGCPRCSST